MACRGELKDDAQRIRDALALGYSVADVARTYGCTPAAVRKVRDGESYGAPKRRGPKPLFRDESDAVGSAGAEARAVIQRALAHWRKNPDMTMSEVADMYDVNKAVLDRARARHEGRHP